MEAKDKFGNEIYQATWDKMIGFARVLMARGYRESRSKPNLFYRSFAAGCFFADMRGTEEVPIWSDPSPLFYVQWADSSPDTGWLRRRYALAEFNTLRFCRLSFYEEFEPGGLLFGEGGDGFCIVCGADFKSDGLYCSAQCQRVSESLGTTKCRVCGEVLKLGQTIEHHLDYAEDKTIVVCRGCHMKIHRGSRFPALKPADKRP